MRFITILLILAGLAGAQLPDAPSAVQQTRLEQFYAEPKPTNMEVLKDPYFLWPTIGQWAVAFADVGISYRGIDRSRGCFEGNTDLGRGPGLGKLIGINLAIEGAVTGLRFAAFKAVPKGKHSKIIRAFSIGSAGWSMYVHGRGIRQWVQTGCL